MTSLFKTTTHFQSGTPSDSSPMHGAHHTHHPRCLWSSYVYLIQDGTDPVTVCLWNTQRCLERGRSSAHFCCTDGAAHLGMGMGMRMRMRTATA